MPPTHDSAPARPSDASGPSRPARRFTGRGVLLLFGVAVTLVSALALLGCLAAYALGQTPSFLPVLYALSMFGLPLGFGLMLLHVVLAAVARARA
ncbi:hypothetical protein [Micrococcus sp.]|uniref:hypothetical protein n=1 Tax=Micrococcus sp. TaxID=1271 RepID=UPI002A911218|nr:hypothetical protein [Micrococcus sp.]MDY6055761.1 hypothetical protein [Micrococcus sp.]